jgi:anti-sigma factor (TIGR02949 family)
MARDKCHDALTRLYPYLDREVTVYRKFRVRRHLRKCANCGPAFSFEEQLRVVVRERSQQDPPPELISRLRQYIAGERDA